MNGYPIGQVNADEDMRGLYPLGDCYNKLVGEEIVQIIECVGDEFQRTHECILR